MPFHAFDRTWRSCRIDGAYMKLAPTHYQFRIPAFADAWASRMEAGCRVLESHFDTQLNLAAGGTKFRTTRNAVTNRDTFFRKLLKTKNRGFGLSNAARGAESVGIGGSMIHGLDVFQVNTLHPDRGFQFTEAVLVALGDAVEAQSSQFTPAPALQRMVKAQWCTVWEDRVTRLDPGELTPEEAQLPPIASNSLRDVPHPLMPHHLGWCNYWSEEVCEYVGFPAALTGHPILEDCYRTPRGAWVVKLGREPFEPGNVTQLGWLREIYERLPRVAMRIAEGTPVHEIPRPDLPNNPGLG
jgi:hypothetical protein